MKIFLDTANLEEIQRAADFGVLDGITTNPTLAAKEGRPFRELILAWKIHDFISTKGLAMVQIRCLGRFETKSEAFACPNIPQQTVSFFQIFLIDRWSRDLINDRAVPMVEQFFSRLPSGALA